jgi:hypothetical protein
MLDKKFDKLNEDAIATIPTTSIDEQILARIREEKQGARMLKGRRTVLGPNRSNSNSTRTTVFLCS